MTPPVETRREPARGCGYRKTGGLYLVGSTLGKDCGRFPIACDCCPTCGQGIKPARGWTWIEPDKIAGKCRHYNEPLSVRQQVRQGFPETKCGACSFGPGEVGRAGLLWVGQQFYPTPGQFLQECHQLGVSRRINVVPRGLVVGETWVFLGHREVIENPSFAHGGIEPSRLPGIFAAFRPRAIEYVVSGQEHDDELETLVARGFTLVRVERVGEQLETPCS